MTALTHEPRTWYAGAEDCGHIAPPEPVLPDDPSDLAWEAWDDDHPYGSEGERICLDAPAGQFCPACTAYARDEGMCGDDTFIAAADCVYGPRGEAA